jgi:hypothetical protein
VELIRNNAIMKYIYNVTYHIAPEVSAQWQAWIGEHMPQWLEQSQFSQVKLLKIHIDHPDSEAFSLQYETEDSSVVAHFQSALEPTYRRTLYEQFGEKVLSFGTLLEELAEVKSKR